MTMPNVRPTADFRSFTVPTADTIVPTAPIPIGGVK